MLSGDLHLMNKTKKLTSSLKKHDDFNVLRSLMNEELNWYLLSLMSTGSKLNGDSKFSLKSEVVETEMLIISLSIEEKF